MRIFLLTFVFVLSTFSQASGDDLRVYAEITGSSAMYEKGELTGAAVEIAKEIMHRTGSEYPIVAVPWARGYDALLRDSNVVLFATTKTEEREPLFKWVGPIIRAQWVMIARKGEGHLVNSLEDAKKLRAIGTYHGDAREQYLESIGFTNLDSANDMITSYRKLASGRLDMLVGTDVGFERLVELAGLSQDMFETAFVIGEKCLYFAFSGDMDPAIVSRWRDAFESMRKDGTYAALYRKWYPGVEVPLN